MIKCLLLVINLFIADSIHAQSTSSKFNLNDTLNPFYTTITYRLACNYAAKKQVDSCLLLINCYLRHTSREAGITAILSSPEINANIKDVRWIRMRDSMVTELKAIYGDKLNPHLFLQLLKYETEDQDARFGALSSNKKVKYQTGFVDTLNLKHLKFVDSLLTHSIELNKNTVGEEGMKAIFLFIQHCQNKERQETYENQIRKWVSSGDIKKEDYAIYIDRLKVRQNMAQVYGSQYWTDKENNKLVLYPVGSVSELTKNRKLMGLQSIQLYLLSVELFEGKKFRRESVAGILKGDENLQDYISKELYAK
ncbi:MAG: DUF6624 domain-containing protein [Bacteroidota bacterium]